MPEVRLEPNCFDAETGEELGDGKVSDRMIVIEWSAEALSVVYCFANRVLDAGITQSNSLSTNALHGTHG